MCSNLIARRKFLTSQHTCLHNSNSLISNVCAWVVLRTNFNCVGTTAIAHWFFPSPLSHWILFSQLRLTVFSERNNGRRFTEKRLNVAMVTERLAQCLWCRRGMFACLIATQSSRSLSPVGEHSNARNFSHSPASTLQLIRECMLYYYGLDWKGENVFLFAQHQKSAKSERTK